MNTSKTCIATAACALAMLASPFAQAAGTVVLNENFNQVGTMANWLMVNQSLPAGQSWFQGNPGVFAAHAGPAGSYIGASYLSAGLNDMLELRFSAGGGTDTSGFSTLLATIGGPNAYPDDWSQFTANLNVTGTGRFAFRYVGDAAVANYIGIDSVRVMTAVPEPTGYLMLGLGLAVVSLLLPKSRT
jgi:hypothetical protein